MNIKMRKKLGDVFFYGILFLLIVIVFGQVGIIPLRFVYVRSGSMSPSFDVGDLAIVKIDSGFEPKVDDIILFNQLGNDVIHRVISIDGKMITTKGDANNDVDPIKITQPKGLFLFSIPLLGYVFVFIQINIFWIITVILLAILLEILYKNTMFPFNKLKKEPK